VDALAVWWHRLIADQALERVHAIIRARQYELEALVEEARTGQHPEPQPSEQHIARATQLTKQELPTDRARANELLDRLEIALPLFADSDRLRLMLETELDEDKKVLPATARGRARELLESRDDDAHAELEALVTAAIRERNDRRREERITTDLRQNYLTWLGTVLLVLLVFVSGLSILAARSGLWADVLLAVFAGALGGTLSGVLRLRAPESRLAALKNLGLIMLVQPLVGAVGGLILFAIWKCGLLSIAGLKRDNWASVPVVAFAGGFSERFFLKTIKRFIGSSERPKEAGADG
jgi:hypothetical protein